MKKVVAVRLEKDEYDFIVQRSLARDCSIGAAARSMISDENLAERLERRLEAKMREILSEFVEQ